MNDPLPDFDQWWDYDRPAETEARFLALAPAARESGAAGYYAELLTQVARTQSLQRRFDDAHRTLDEAQSLLNGKLSGGRVQIRCLLERGRTFNSAGRAAEAKRLFVQAWEMTRAAGEDGYAVDAAHMIAIVETGTLQMEWNLKALALAEKSPQPEAQKWLGSLYNNLGWAHHDAGRFIEALELFEKALRFRQDRGDGPRTRIAKWCVARCLRSLGRVEEALALQQSLQSEFERIGESDGYVPEEIGECLLALGRGGEAAPHFAQAYALLSKDAGLAGNEPARLSRLKELGQAV